MHRVPAKHRALRRSIAGLDARDPQLLSPLNSVPVLAPLVSTLLGNGAGSGAQPSTSPNAQPAPVPTTGSGGGSGNGGNGGNGNGGNGGTGGNGGSSGNGGNGGSGGNNGNSGNSGNGGDSGGSTPTPTAPPTSGGGTGVSPVPIVPSQTFPTSAPGNKSGASNASGGTVSSSSLGGNFLGVGGAQVNAGPGSSSNTASTALGTSTAGVQATDFLSASQYSLGSNPVSTASPSPTIATSAAILSGGAIAGITIVCLTILLVLILLVIRRRSIARRMEIRGKWWFGHHASGGKCFLVNNGSPHSSTLGSSGETPASRLSSRSSFATNFDQGLMLHVDSPQRLSHGVLPDFPPLVEVRERNAALISTGGAIARRESINSMLSGGSEPDAQYLTASGQKNLEPSTPMSVRPFSPSESFAFPKPPAPLSSTVDPCFLSGAQGPTSSRSSATLVHLSPPPRAFMTDLPLVSVSTPSPNLQTSTSSDILSPPSAANPSVDPFADPQTPGFADVEVIRRPFKPSLNDELAVCPGDRVRLVQVFDDGWVSIEKLADTEGKRHERGLIPVDCLRETSQALPTFLTEKRVTIYGLDEPTAL